MFRIQRYEVDDLQEISTLATERLTKINDRVRLKGEHAAKEKTQPEIIKALQIHQRENTINNKKSEISTNKKVTSRNESVIEIKEQDGEGINLIQNEGHTEELKVLHSFPTFDKPIPTPQEVAAAKLLGIPDWLANPTVVDPEITLPIDDSSLGLSDRLRNRCKALGIHECFAG
jgi:hypothetical protein